MLPQLTGIGREAPDLNRVHNHRNGTKRASTGGFVLGQGEFSGAAVAFDGRDMFDGVIALKILQGAVEIVFSDFDGLDLDGVFVPAIVTGQDLCAGLKG